MITACPKCGGKEFTVVETLIWDAEVFEPEGDKKLYAHHCRENYIDTVSCKKCGDYELSIQEQPEIEFTG
jgi:predicted  nucleic acid-binding Zn-ribbon protein